MGYNNDSEFILKGRSIIEIERKYLIPVLPEHINEYPHDSISQAYISTNPVIRIRKKNESYILTVKSSGLMVREETEFSISKESYDNLQNKAEGNIIKKTRYRIPEKDGLTIELDIFEGAFEGLVMAEVEFTDINQAEDYTPPAWFGKEVTHDHHFHNSYLSLLKPGEIKAFLDRL